MVVTAILELGITYNHKLSLTDAVRSGARVAAVSRSAPDPVDAAKSAVTTAGSDLDGFDKNEVDVHYSASDPSGLPVSGSTVTVSASYPYSISIFGISLMSGSLKSSTTERVE